MGIALPNNDRYSMCSSSQCNSRRYGTQSVTKPVLCMYKEDGCPWLQYLIVAVAITVRGLCLRSKNSDNVCVDQLPVQPGCDVLGHVGDNNRGEGVDID